MARNHKEYFGKTMPFTDNEGTEYAESFWHLQNFSIDTDNRIIYLNFVAYASIEAFESESESLVKKGGSWAKTHAGENYHRLIAIFAPAVAGVALATWQIAALTKDTPGETEDFESFFASAGAVIAPEEMQALLKN
ncbi:MAG TPA: hypothetical protein VGC97_25590 [Pyrinomonadaceae bacterium]|jgi:hypothetical protein